MTPHNTEICTSESNSTSNSSDLRLFTVLDSTQLLEITETLHSLLKSLYISPQVLMHVSSFSLKLSDRLQVWTSGKIQGFALPNLNKRDQRLVFGNTHDHSTVKLH